jgi:hypothetical protein
LLCASLSTTLSPKIETDSSGHKVDNLSTKIQHQEYHSIDKKHYFCHVKFQMGFVISFRRKSMTSKKWHFSWGMIHPFFEKAKFENFDRFSVFWSGGRQEHMVLA